MPQPVRVGKCWACDYRGENASLWRNDNGRVVCDTCGHDATDIYDTPIVIEPIVVAALMHADFTWTGYRATSAKAQP